MLAFTTFGTTKRRFALLTWAVALLVGGSLVLSGSFFDPDGTGAILHLEGLTLTGGSTPTSFDLPAAASGTGARLP